MYSSVASSYTVTGIAGLGCTDSTLIVHDKLSSSKSGTTLSRRKFHIFFFFTNSIFFAYLSLCRPRHRRRMKKEKLKVPKKKSLKRLLCRETTSFTWHLCHFIKTFLIIFLARGFVSWTAASSTLPHQSRRTPNANSFVRTIEVTRFDQYFSELN